jgi:hypothetical protein
MSPVVAATLVTAGVDLNLKPCRLFVCINTRSDLFLWPAPLPGDRSGGGREWYLSGLRVAEAA